MVWCTIHGINIYYPLSSKTYRFNEISVKKILRASSSDWSSSEMNLLGISVPMDAWGYSSWSTYKRLTHDELDKIEEDRVKFPPP